MHTIQPITECPQTCSDSGPNGLRVRAFPHGQTDPWRVLVRILKEVSRQLSMKAIFMHHALLIMQASVAVPHAEGNDVGMQCSLMYSMPLLSTPILDGIGVVKVLSLKRLEIPKETVVVSALHGSPSWELVYCRSHHNSRLSRQCAFRGCAACSTERFLRPAAKTSRSRREWVGVPPQNQPLEP